MESDNDGSESSERSSYETDSEEDEADSSKIESYQEKILRNNLERQKVLEAIQLNEVKESFTEAIKQLKPAKKKTHQKIDYGPLREKSQRYKNKERKNLSEEFMFAQVFQREKRDKYELSFPRQYSADSRRSSRLKDIHINYSIENLLNQVYNYDEEKEEKKGNVIEVNEMKSPRNDREIETFCPTTIENSEWPKVLICRLPDTEVQ